MTIKYECDRCHKQSDDDLMFLTVNVKRKIHMLTERPEYTYHYCKECTVYFLNGVNNINNRTYDGMVKE